MANGSCVLHESLSIVCCQMCELTGELELVQEERENLVSAQAVSNEDNERLRGEAVKVQEELEKMQKDLADAELKEVQLNQQHTETKEQLEKIQTDLQRLLEENGSLFIAFEEAKQKVSIVGWVFHLFVYLLLAPVLSKIPEI